MPDLSIADFACLINNHIQVHEDIDHRLAFLEGQLEFTFTCDFRRASPDSVRAQKLNLCQHLYEIKRLNVDLQAKLIQSLQRCVKRAPKPNRCAILAFLTQDGAFSLMERKRIDKQGSKCASRKNAFPLTIQSKCGRLAVF